MRQGLRCCQCLFTLTILTKLSRRNIPKQVSLGEVLNPSTYMSCALVVIATNMYSQTPLLDSQIVQSMQEFVVYNALPLSPENGVTLGCQLDFASFGDDKI